MRPGPTPEPLWSRRLRELSLIPVDHLFALSSAVKECGDVADWTVVGARVSRSANECRQLFATMCLSRPPLVICTDEEYVSKVESQPWGYSNLVQPLANPNWVAEIIRVAPPSQPPPVVAPAAVTESPVDKLALEQNGFAVWAVNAMRSYNDEAALVKGWMALSPSVKLEYIRVWQSEQKLKAMWGAHVHNPEAKMA